MQVAQFFPFWQDLTAGQRGALQQAAQLQRCAAKSRINAK